MDKFCQICSMPLNGTELIDRQSDGTKTEEYCLYCYQEGKFPQPELTLADND
ncbi:MAG: transcriptional regulator [Anaerosporomusa subterranea]|jgi:hypothetical protein|nr:transcriptional regulator [Anaerosporomusa subterranea]